MKKVIFDASPLIFMAKADMLSLIKKMYKKVFLSSYIMSEIEKPIELGYRAPEVDEIKKSDVVNILEISVKEVMQAVIVADARAQRKMKELKVAALDLVDFSFLVAKRGFMNPREFAKRLYDRAHYRTQRIRDILGK